MLYYKLYLMKCVAFVHYYFFLTPPCLHCGNRHSHLRLRAACCITIIMCFKMDCVFFNASVSLLVIFENGTMSIERKAVTKMLIFM